METKINTRQNLKILTKIDTLGSLLNLVPPPELSDENMVSLIDFDDSSNFFSEAVSNKSVIFDRYQNKTLGSEKLSGAWTVVTGWTDNGNGRFTFNDSAAARTLSQPAGGFALGKIVKFTYTIVSSDTTSSFYINNGASSSIILDKTVGTHTIYFAANGAAATFSVRHNATAAGTSLVVEGMSAKDVAGNHMITGTGSVFGVLETNQLLLNLAYYISYPAAVAATNYIVAKREGDYDYSVFTDLTDIGGLDSNVLWVGKIPPSGAYKNISVKAIIRRNVAAVEQSVVDYLTKFYCSTPRIVIPSTIYAVKGVEFNLFTDSVILGIDNGDSSPTDYKVTISCGTLGSQSGRKYSYTPVAGDIGTHNLTVSVKKYGIIISSKTVNLVVIDNTAPAAASAEIMNVGDSITAVGSITQSIHDQFNALGANVPVFQGFRGTAPIRNQGLSGWSYTYYATTTLQAYKFVVTGTTNVNVGDTYVQNGVQLLITEKVISGGNGYIKCTYVGSNAISASGTITISLGTGDETITYTSQSKVAASPFFNAAGSIDIANLKSNLGVTNFNVVTFQLGVNGSNTSLMTDATRITEINHAKTLIDALIADNAAIKIIIEIPTSDNNLATGFGDATTKKNYRYNLQRLREMILRYFDNSVYHANVTVGISGLAIDRFNGYGTDELHPNATGCEQIGRGMFPNILKLLQ